MDGMGGFGQGRGADIAQAVAKGFIILKLATRQAKEQMMFIPRLDNRTVTSDVTCQYGAVKLNLWTVNPGYGIVANNYVHEVCRAVGISDIGSKIHGSKNPMNVIKATFAALAMQRSPEVLARQRGKRIVDVQRTYYGVALKE
jgi:ribosomal protein S5